MVSGSPTLFQRLRRSRRAGSADAASAASTSLPSRIVEPTLLDLEPVDRSLKARSVGRTMRVSGDWGMGRRRPMSFFGAVRLYVVSVDRIERHLAPFDDGSLPPSRDGAWARWARMGDSGGEMDPLPPMSRVEPGPVHVAHRWSDPA
jgi:hypothetical protein